MAEGYRRLNYGCSCRRRAWGFLADPRFGKPNSRQSAGRHGAMRRASRFVYASPVLIDWKIYRGVSCSSLTARISKETDTEQP